MADHTPGPKSKRKSLDAQFVGNVNADAMNALGDVKARRKWPDSKSGSPITTNLLCAEIARLNIERAELVAALKNILAANKEFRAGMPSDWEGDPLQDACEAARSALHAGEGE